MLLVQEIKGLREELSTRFNSTETLELIREKEEQIKGLLEEGKDISRTGQGCSRTFPAADDQWPSRTTPAAHDKPGAF